MRKESYKKPKETHVDTQKETYGDAILKEINI
jgi:hypothetical protein